MSYFSLFNLPDFRVLSLQNLQWELNHANPLKPALHMSRCVLSCYY